MSRPRASRMRPLVRLSSSLAMLRMFCLARLSARSPFRAATCVLIVLRSVLMMPTSVLIVLTSVSRALSRRVEP